MHTNVYLIPGISFLYTFLLVCTRTERNSGRKDSLASLVKTSLRGWFES